jgi:hypothetical protein
MERIGIGRTTQVDSEKMEGLLAGTDTDTGGAGGDWGSGGVAGLSSLSMTIAMGFDGGSGGPGIPTRDFTTTSIRRIG